MRTRIHSLIRFLTVLLLLGHASMALGQGMKILSGRVYEGPTGSEPPTAKPIEGVTVKLYGSQQAGVDDPTKIDLTFLRETTTDPENGWYGLEVYPSDAYDYFNIIETNKGTYVDSDPPGATAATNGGTVKSPNWIQYGYGDIFVFGKTLTGNKFWDKPVGQSENHPPVADDQPVYASEDTPKAFTLTASDPDNNPLTWHLMSQPSHGTLSGTAPNLTYTPDHNYNGQDSFTFRVHDGWVYSNTATVSITIRPVNDPPVAVSDFYSVVAGQILQAGVAGVPGVLDNDTDPENDALTAAKVSGPSHASSMTLNSDGSFTYTPTLGFSGQDSFTYTASDIHGSTDTATVNIVVSVAPPGTGVIKGFKFEDVDEQGDYDAAEPKMGGWTIYLDHWELVGGGVSYGWKQIGTTTTKTSGLDIGTYSFDSLAAGRYRVREEKKLNWVQSYPPGGVWDVTLSDGQVVENRNFGNYRPAPLVEEEEGDYGDAPEDAIAYPGRPGEAGVRGHFPTCTTVGPPGSFIRHASSANMYFGTSADSEPDGNGGQCDGFPPYDWDESFGGDAGLTMPGPYTISATGKVILCAGSTGTALGKACGTAVWGADIDIDVEKYWIGISAVPDAYVNVLVDWNQDGQWGGESLCTNGKAPEHILRNCQIEHGHGQQIGPLSIEIPLSARQFKIGPKSGYVWARFTISGRRVTLPWDGSGIFGEGETEDYLLRIDPADGEAQYDYGDAPKPYPDAWDPLGGPYAGIFATDAEEGSQNSSGADGDDLHGTPDEDGLIRTDFVVGKPALAVALVRPSGGMSSGSNCGLWIDFDHSKNWDVLGESLTPFHSMSPSGLDLYYWQFTVPSNVTPGPTYARLRVVEGSNTPVSPVGLGGPGEVEDHLIPIEADGAGLPPGGIILGFKWEDLDGDGAWDQGEPPVPGWRIWVDSNHSGRFDSKDLSVKTEERGYFQFTGLKAGTYNVCEEWQADWRQTSSPQYHTVRIDGDQDVHCISFGNQRTSVPGGGQQFDYGDAPASYVVAMPDPVGIDPFVYLGGPADPDTSHQTDPDAVGDDHDGNDDEDGVQFDPQTPLIGGTQANVTVIVSEINCFLSAWIDFNQNGDWQDAGEQIFDNLLVNQGANNLSFTVAPGAATGPTFARFRLLEGVCTSTLGGLCLKFEPGNRGEIEDYKIELGPAEEGGDLDYGDAPYDGAAYKYPDAWHSLGGPYLGSVPPDAETGSQNKNSSLADGDDLNGTPGDEDGFMFALSSDFVVDKVAFPVISVRRGQGIHGSFTWGLWIDLNRDGDWADPGESITRHCQWFSSTVANVYCGGFAVPSNVTPGPTYARIRVVDGSDLDGSYGPLLPSGLGGPGEVEDHLIQILPAGSGLPPGVALPPTGGVAPGGVLPPVPTLPPGYCIWGYKYNDLNGNGLWDKSGTPSEPVLPNWTIRLHADNGGTPDGYTSTNASGVFIFPGLKPQSQLYTVGEETQVDWTQTYPTSGTHSVEIKWNQSQFPGILFGNQQTDGPGPDEIGVSKWVDHDGDRKQDVDDFDIGLHGWGFWLDKNNNGLKDAGEPEDKTNSMGFLTFTGLTPGTYVVHEESLPGWKQTVPGNNGVYTVTLPLPAGQANEVLQFANQQTGGPGLPPGVALPPSGGVAPGGVLPPVPTLPPGYCIWGYKYNDLNGNHAWDLGEKPVANWPVWLDTNNDGQPDTFTSTDSSGVFIFAGLQPRLDPYKVGEETQVGWTQTYPAGGTHSVTIQPNQNSFTGILFGNQQTGGPGPGEGERWRNLKWSQPPVEIDPKVGQTPVFCGWDEPAFSVQTSAQQRRWTMVADDFHCLGPIPVTSVRWWGSFAGWTDRAPPLVAPTVFHIGIWTGVPADTASPWGRPEKLVWETTAADWTWEFAGYEQSAAGAGTSVPSVGLVARWKLDGDAKDSAGASHGTVRGNPVWATGKVDRALRLDGLDDYVELPIGSRISQLTSSTFALWVNWSVAGGPWQRIFDFGKGQTAYMFLCPRLDTSGPMRFAITTGGSEAEQRVTAPTALAGGWHHVAVVIDAAAHTTRLYLDGDVVAANTAMTLTPSALGQTTQNWLGRSQYGGDGYYQGLIDDVLIYNRALSANEIKSLVAPAQQQTEEACFEFNHDLPTADWFHQERFQTQQEVFWISITAMYPGSSEGTNPWGWMSRPAGWNNGAVRFERTGAQLQPGLVLAPQGMAFVQDEVACGSVQDYDMAFELRTDPPWVKSDQPFTGLGDWPYYDDRASYATEATNGVVTIVQQVADDWPGVYPQDPVIAMAWEGSYIGYGYEACQCGSTVEPRRPDYFQLLIRTNLPPDAGNPLDRPADVVWAYEVFDYDEVLVGYDRHPSGEPNEPVFRYSARLPRDKWFWHEGEKPYWLSIMAVYVARADQIKYPWGWTDHKHQFGSAASKLSSTNQGLVREPLSDPTGGLIDMSFTLYTTSESRPIAYWRFDETQGTIAVDSVGGHNGTIHGATWTTGAAGGALRFDGGDYVEVSDEADFDITGAITVAAWVSLEAVPAEWIGIVTKGDSTWRLSTLLSERRFHFAVNDPQGAFHAVDGTTSVGLNEWHHVVGTYDGSSIRLYVDEVEDPASPVAYTGPIHVDDFLVWIGANAERPGRGFVGRIDEVRVYDVALSQAEVLDLMALADNTAPGRSMPGR